MQVFLGWLSFAVTFLSSRKAEKGEGSVRGEIRGIRVFLAFPTACNKCCVLYLASVAHDDITCLVLLVKSVSLLFN